jgi:hypothetical protein
MLNTSAFRNVWAHLRINAHTGISVPLVRAFLMDVLLLMAGFRIGARLLGLLIGVLLLLLVLIILFLV